MIALRQEKETVGRRSARAVTGGAQDPLERVTFEEHTALDDEPHSADVRDEASRISINDEQIRDLAWSDRPPEDTACSMIAAALGDAKSRVFNQVNFSTTGIDLSALSATFGHLRNTAGPRGGARELEFSVRYEF